MGVASAAVPRVSEDTLPFWRYAANGELRMQRCPRCRTLRWPPAPVCPACWCPDAVWERLLGAARLRAWVVYRDGSAVSDPYAVGLAELTEGPRYTARLEVPADRLHDDLMLRVAFREQDDVLDDGTPFVLPVLVVAGDDGEATG
jgi:uncharacterized OB-fold protein